MNSRETLSLFMISAASLAYEICLTRIFAIQQFHHFAFIVISLAVMGFAASGIALFVINPQPAPKILSYGFGITGLLAYAVINYLPFDSFRIATDSAQIWILLLYFTSAGLPFLCAGWYIGQTLHKAGESVSRPYAANLIGSALGCVLALISLQLTAEEGALGIAITLGFLTTLLLEPRPIRQGVILLLAVLTATAFLKPLSFLRLQLSPYKALSIAQEFPEARVIATAHNASARIDVLDSQGIHSYPGLSLTSPSPPSDQMGLFIDGEGPFPLTRFENQPGQAMAFSRHMPDAIAYMLRPNAKVLIINPGTGLAAQVALALGADQVSLPTDQPLIPQLLNSALLESKGYSLDDERIQTLQRTSRGALSSQARDYSIIEWALSDPYRPITSGAFSLTDNYLLTQEAFETGWQRLSVDGLMVITRWLGTPPSEATRAWSTVVQALRHQGVTDPMPHLVAFRGMRTMTILVSKMALGDDELGVIRGFLTQNALDPVFLPDLQLSELNQFNRLPEDLYSSLFTALLENPGDTIKEYEFRLEPARDDRPYFFHFFRWVQSSQVLATLGIVWQPFGGSGYFVLLALLSLMLLLATPLILIPWLIFRRDPGKKQPSRWVWLYFGGLGAGYLLVEIPLILRLNLLLDYPVLSFGLVLFSLLLSSGIGSLLSRRIPLRSGLLILLGLLLLNITLLPLVIAHVLALTLGMRILAGMLWLAPLGIFMGIPFAAGMRVMENRTPGLIPWAWAINGAVSGISGVLASLALLDLGFRLTLGLGMVSYGIVLFAAHHWMGNLCSRFAPAS